MQELNNWQRLGQVYKWIRPQNLTPIELSIYLYITEMTVGYGQYTSETLSHLTISKATGIGRTSITRVISILIGKKLITKVATNQIANVGKLPYKYQLNMKLPMFPSLGTLVKNREAQIGSIKLDQYLIVNGKLFQHTINGKVTKAWKDYSKTEDIELINKAVTPTLEEFNKLHRF